MVRVHRIFDERHLPLAIRPQHRTLVELAVAPVETRATIGVANEAQVAAAWRRRGPTGHQRRILVRATVAVDAFNLNGLRNLSHDMAIAMRILREVAVNTMHAVIDVNRRHMHGLFPLLRVVVVDLAALRIQQIAFAVTFEDGTEVPAAT